MKHLLNEKENTAADAFMWKHYAKHKKTAEVMLTATATGIATHIKITCPYCRKSEDLSDYGCW